MKLKIGFKMVEYKTACVVLLRTPYTNDIIYNSGVMYFTSKKQYALFKKKLRKQDRRLEVIRVYIKNAKAPSFYGIADDDMVAFKRQKKMFCPYCGQVETWKEHQCPVCGISDNEFYTKTFNHTWESGLKKAERTDK